MEYANEWEQQLFTSKRREQYQRALKDTQTYLKAIPSNVGAQTIELRVLVTLTALNHQSGKTSLAKTQGRKLLPYANDCPIRDSPS